MKTFRVVNGLLVEAEYSELLCSGCWRELKGHYYSVHNKKYNIMLCITCYKLIQTLWRLEKLELLDHKNWTFTKSKIKSNSKLHDK